MPKRTESFTRCMRRLIYSIMAQKDFEKVTEASNYLYEEMLNRGLREGRVIGPAQIEAEITNPVEYDARGYVPSASIINFYAEMGVCEGKLGKDWLQDILREIDLQESDGELREPVWLKDQGRLADEELGRIMISLERKHNLIHNLPQNRLYDFTGTAHNLTEISNWLLATRRPQTSLESEEVCGLLVGERGLGKSTIIKEAGWACAGEPRNEAEKFAWPGFSYIFYFNANEESLTLEKLLQQMAFMFGQPGKVTDNPNLQLTVAETLQKPGNESLLIIDNYAGVQDKELKKFLSQVKSGFGLTILLTARPEDLAALSENEMTFRKIELSSLREDKACELFLRLIEKQLKVRPDTPENASINPIENNEVLLSLIKKLGSNPYLIKVYASFMAAQRTSPREVLDRLNATKAHQFSLIFGDITGQIWDKCGYDARQLWAILYFFSKPVTTGMLREVSGFHTRRFNRAVAELETYRVLEAEGEGAFRACELVKAFGKAQIKDFDEMSFRKRWVTYYIEEVVRQNLVVEKEDYPKKRSTSIHEASKLFWNSLVNGVGNKIVEREWENIREVLNWVSDWEDCHERLLRFKQESLIRMMLMLTHHMNALKYSQERIKCGKRAIEAAKSLDRNLEVAIFLIDTLGWKFMEKGEYDEARELIKQGLEILQRGYEGSSLQVVAKEWLVFGYAFLARTYLEQNLLEEATIYLDEFKNFDGEPVVKHRVKTVAGNICLVTGKTLFKEGAGAGEGGNRKIELALEKFEEARKYYRQALVAGETCKLRWEINQARYYLGVLNISIASARKKTGRSASESWKEAAKYLRMVASFEKPAVTSLTYLANKALAEVYSELEDEKKFLIFRSKAEKCETNYKFAIIPEGAKTLKFI